MFGSIQVRVGGQEFGPRDFGGVKPKQILEILLVERGHSVPKDRLADSLWGESLPKNVSATLETYVSVLRRRFGQTGRGEEPVVVTEPGAYRFASERAEIDLDRFDELVQRAAGAETRAARIYLEEALALARGEVLEDEPYAIWTERIRDSYREAFVQALLDAGEAALGERDYPAGLGHAQRAMASDHLNERAYRIAMMAQYALGRQQDALRTFERCRDVLDEELGVAPLPQTEALYLAIRRHEDSDALMPAPAPDAVELPAPARAPAALIGRAEEVAMLREAAERALAGSFALVVVEGEEGAGKTSVVEAAMSGLDGARSGRARCSQLEQDMPYVPLAMALRDALDGAPGDLSAYPGLEEVFPELGPSDEGAASPVRTLESLVRLVRDHAPMVLLLDDAQWADSATIAALSYLEHRCKGAPLLVVAALRPEEVGSKHPLRSLRPTATIRLQPLTPEDLEALAPGLYERTGGHPPFVVELLRSGAPGSEGDVPESLRHLVLARVRSAGDDAHRILATASVLGAAIDPEVLAGMLHARPAEVAEELERLSDRGLLRATPSGFGWNGELVREVLCASLSPGRRRVLERLAMEGLHGSTVRSMDFDELIG